MNKSTKTRTLRFIDLFKLRFADTSLEHAATMVCDLERQGARHVCFVNAHCVNVMARDGEYRTALERADLRFVDGIGMALASKLKRFGEVSNLNGTDLLPYVLKEAAKRKLRVALIGAKEGVARLASKRLKRQIPDLNVVLALNGYLKDDVALLLLSQASPDLVLVARGVPLQECWVEGHRALLPSATYCSVGAFLDFASGRVRRAPQLVRFMKMEWVWRLLSEPKRLWRRYLIGNIEFLSSLNNRLKESYTWLSDPITLSARG